MKNNTYRVLKPRVWTTNKSAAQMVLAWLVRKVRQLWLGGRVRVRDAVAALGVKQRFIRAGRPQTNGAVERVQRTILEECWRPTFAMSLAPKYTTLRRDLVAYLRYYNFRRAHTGQRSSGRPQAVGVWQSIRHRALDATSEPSLDPRITRASARM